MNSDIIRVHLPNFDNLEFDVWGHFHDVTMSRYTPIWEFGDNVLFNPTRLETCVVPKVIHAESFNETLTNVLSVEEEGVQAYTFYVNHTNTDIYDTQHLGTEGDPFLCLHAAIYSIYETLKCLCPDSDGGGVGKFIPTYIQLKIKGKLTQRFLMNAIREFPMSVAYCLNEFIIIYDFSDAEVCSLDYSKINSDTEIHKLHSDSLHMLDFGVNSIVKNLKCVINIDGDYIDKSDYHTSSHSASYYRSFVYARLLYHCDINVLVTKFVKERLDTGIRYLFEYGGYPVCLVLADLGIVGGSYNFNFNIDLTKENIENLYYDGADLYYKGPEITFNGIYTTYITSDSEDTENDAVKIQSNIELVHDDKILSTRVSLINCAAMSNGTINTVLGLDSCRYGALDIRCSVLENTKINSYSNIHAFLPESRLQKGSNNWIGGGVDVRTVYLIGSYIDMSGTASFKEGTALKSFVSGLSTTGVLHECYNRLYIAYGINSEMLFDVEFTGAVIPENSREFAFFGLADYSIDRPARLLNCNEPICTWYTSAYIDGTWVAVKKERFCL